MRSVMIIIIVLKMGVGIMLMHFSANSKNGLE